jgi:hypothetical protein
MINMADASFCTHNPLGFPDNRQSSAPLDDELTASQRRVNGESTATRSLPGGAGT